VEKDLEEELGENSERNEQRVEVPFDVALYLVFDKANLLIFQSVNKLNKDRFVVFKDV
jgi:hypothetical protein